VGLLAGHTTLRAHTFKVGPTRGRIANCAVMKKKIHIVCHRPVWHAKDTEPWVICFEVQGYGNQRVYGLIRLVVSNRLGVIP